MFDGNGNWTSEFSAQVDRDNGIKILASRFDNIFIADLKESFENCITKDGQIGFVGDINLSGNKIINVKDGTNTTDAVNKGQLDSAKSELTSNINTLLRNLYPVGSIYIGTQATCPLATLIAGSQWTLISGRYLLASGTLAGTSETFGATNYVGAGLPDHMHTISSTYATHGQSGGNGYQPFCNGDSPRQLNPSWGTSWASASNGIYGSSGTVRPPAYVVNVWRRTA